MYICEIHGADISSEIVPSSEKQTSIEIPYSSLTFKDSINHPNPVKVFIEVLALGESEVIGIGGPFAAGKWCCFKEILYQKKS